MLGNLGVILVVGGVAAIIVGALKKLEIDVETKFEVGGYELETDTEFEIDKMDGKRRRKHKHGNGERRGRDRTNPEEQPNQIDTERPMLVPENIEPYYNRFILY